MVDVVVDVVDVDVDEVVVVVEVVDVVEVVVAGAVVDVVDVVDVVVVVEPGAGALGVAHPSVITASTASPSVADPRRRRLTLSALTTPTSACRSPRFPDRSKLWANDRTASSRAGREPAMPTIADRSAPSPPPQAGASKSGTVRLPLSSSGRPGLWATSQTCPSGSRKHPA